MNHENHHNGKEIAAAKEADKRAGHSPEALWKKFLICLVLTIPVLLYSGLFDDIFAWRPPSFAGSPYLPLLLSTVVFFYGGWLFTRGAVNELRKRAPGMMVLVSLAVWAAYLFSVFETIRGGRDALFWELTTLITVMLLGHFLEMRAVQKAGGALRELAALLPETAEVVRDGKSEIIPLGRLREGDAAVVRPGGKIPADGVVVEGDSEVNESVITGESRPVPKKTGDRVIAGAINGDGALKIRILQIGEKTFLSGVMRLVAEAQESKSKLQILSDKAAFYLTLTAVFSGGLTFFAWLAAGAETGFAVKRLVAVLVIACPHALGLAVPLVTSISTTLAARRGFLVRQRPALEAARNIDVVLFDKTGTLTKGEYEVEKIVPLSSFGEEEILRLAASVDAKSEHFVSRAIVRKAEESGVAVAKVESFARMGGKGARGVVEEKNVWVGGDAILAAAGAVLKEEAEAAVKKAKKEGKTAVFAVIDGEVAGFIALVDAIRGESREAVDELKRRGVKTAMITGDSAEVAAWVAGQLGIGEFFAGVSPGEKAEKVAALQKRGMKTAMVGDGINDAPALAQADLGVAIGAGTNVAIESAGVILVKNDPRDVVAIIDLSRRAYAKMVQNLFWATAYNIAALPLAAGILFSRGIILEPALSALLMSLSTAAVAVNALTLRRKI